MSEEIEEKLQELYQDIKIYVNYTKHSEYHITLELILQRAKVQVIFTYIYNRNYTFEKNFSEIVKLTEKGILNIFRKEI